MSNRNDTLVDINLIVFYETPKAIKVGVDEEDRHFDCWLPKSLVEIDYTGKSVSDKFRTANVTLPQWLAERENLADHVNE